MAEKNGKSENSILAEPEFEPQLEASIPIIEILKDADAMSALEKLITSIMDRTSRNATGERISQGLGIILLIGAITFLSYVEKMTPSAGVIFGTLAGYIFGKGLE